MFQGLANLVPACGCCGFEFEAAIQGSRFRGRLGALSALLVAAVIGGLALGLDAMLRPPLWLHALLWTPLTVGAVIISQRLTIAAVVRDACRRADNAVPDPKSGDRV